MRLKPVENTIMQSLPLELKPALSLSGVIQKHIFEIPESAAPADGAFQSCSLIVQTGRQAIWTPLAASFN
jgi:hypothetical protein